MHHSHMGFDPEATEKLHKIIEEEAKRLKFGATGQFPDGKLADHDEGEIVFGVSDYEGKVLLNFGRPVASLGMTAEQARHLARALMSHAGKIDKPKRKRRRQRKK